MSKFSPETRKKISDSLKRYNRNKRRTEAKLAARAERSEDRQHDELFLKDMVNESYFRRLQVWRGTVGRIVLWLLLVAAAYGAYELVGRVAG